MCRNLLHTVELTTIVCLWLAGQYVFYLLYFVHEIVSFLERSCIINYSSFQKETSTYRISLGGTNTSYGNAANRLVPGQCNPVLAAEPSQKHIIYNERSVGSMDMWVLHTDQSAYWVLRCDKLKLSVVLWYLSIVLLFHYRPCDSANSSQHFLTDDCLDFKDSKSEVSFRIDWNRFREQKTGQLVLSIFDKLHCPYNLPL